MGRLKFGAVWCCLAAILLLEQLPVCSPEVDETDGGYGSGSDPDRTFVVVRRHRSSQNNNNLEDEHYESSTGSGADSIEDSYIISPLQFSPSAAAPFTPSDVMSNGSDFFFAPIVIEKMTEPPSELLSRTRRTSLLPDVGTEKEYFFRRDFPPTGASEEVEQSWYADYEYEDGELPQNDEPYKPGTPEEDVHIVSCQMDVACNPNDPLAKCTCKNQIEAFGEARCIIPKARVSHISMANSGKMNVFCVGVTLTPPDSDSDYEMQTRCKYYGGNNEKYKVYVTKKVELDELSATEKVRYRACLEPLKD